MGSVQNVDKAFFPLDEELELSTERLTPHAHACLVRYSGIIPSFEKARQELAFALQVEVSEPTARRYTQGAGKAYVGWQAGEVERLERETPATPPAGSEKMMISVDGAMVPLVGGEWAEVKTMTIGEIQAPVLEKGEWVVHSQKHSYFSRIAEAQTFRRLALVESHRRGVENAKIAAAVSDGAEWEQGFFDFHSPNAKRILDFPHAAEHIHHIAQALWETDETTRQAWLGEQLHSLKSSGPEDILGKIRVLQHQHAQVEAVQENFAYLEKRQDHMHYPEYQAQGLPIGSGAMESGNKVVVEARLKGAGMHWAPENVNPMLALRNILCSGRWEEAWPQILTSLRQEERQRKKERLENKRLACQAANSSVPEDRVPAMAEPALPPQPIIQQPMPDDPVHPVHKPHSPAANHPWRHSPIGKAKFLPSFTISKN